MASSESMDESFRARVEKAFGPLSSSRSCPPWSLTDDEVERRQWKRERERSNRDDEIPCSSSFDGLFAKDRRNKSRNTRSELEDDDRDLDEEDDDDDDERPEADSSKQSFRGGDGDANDDWEIRSSIGLDCTLDNEEEEDEYDKVAEGRENAGDRLYMRDATEHGPFLNSRNVLSYSMYDAPGNPRANDFAAHVGLEEDEAAAQKFNSFQTSDELMRDAGEPCAKMFEGGSECKSILKRRDGATECKSQKRVRFDPGCKDECDKAAEIPEEFSTDTIRVVSNIISDDSSVLERSKFKVPDYVLNPTKYKCYSLDSSSELDEGSNRQAYMDFLNLVKGTKPRDLVSESEDVVADISKPVTFIPRKKAIDDKASSDSSVVKKNHEDEPKQSSAQTGFPVCLAAGEAAQQTEICVMEEDEPKEDSPERIASSQKPSRRYRIKKGADESVA